MRIGQAERVRMERAHVAAWPALETADVHGWLWRYSGGGSQRANAVSAIDFTGSDIAAAITAVEASYRAREAPTRFHTFDDTQPPALAETLRLQGYLQADPTITMIRAIAPVDPDTAVAMHDAAWPAWLAVYLGVVTESRRAINQLILNNLPQPSAFFGLARNGRIVATALCVISHRCAVIECVATTADARGSGAARAVLRTLLAWAATQDADLVGLQVLSLNRPALQLYRQFDFVSCATNLFWVRDASPQAAVPR